jgi:hypothetical protein
MHMLEFAAPREAVMGAPKVHSLALRVVLSGKNTLFGRGIGPLGNSLGFGVPEKEARVR